MTQKPILDTRVKRKDNRYPVYIRISEGKKQRLIPTGYRLEPKFWDKDKVKKGHPDAAVINAKIADLLRSISITIASANLGGRKVHFELLGTGRFSPSFVEFINKVAVDYEKSGKVVMGLKAAERARELKLIYGDVAFDQLGPEFVKKLEQHYEKIGNKASTKKKKMQYLGTLLEVARKDKIYDDINWFNEYKGKTNPVVKEKLTPDEIALLEQAKLTGLLDLARDVFLFSFYCKGQRFGDCLFAKRSNIKDDKLVLIDQKTGKLSQHRIHERLRAIIDKYEGEFIFPLASRSRYADTDDKYRKIKLKSGMNSLVNKYLKILATKLGIDKKLSMHIARHSFANQLKELGANPWVIKESLNHTSIHTTENYLKSLNNDYLEDELKKLYGK